MNCCFCTLRFLFYVLKLDINIKLSDDTVFQAVYFTATFPYILMIILFFVGVTLKGAGQGVEVLFKPKVREYGNFE